MAAGVVGRAIERFSTLLTHLSMLGIMAMMLIVVVDVALRTFAGTSLLLAEEVCGYLLVLVAYFAYAEALKRNRHVRVELASKLIPERARTRIELVLLVLALGAMSVVTWTAVVMVYRSYERGVIVPGILLTPVWIPQLAMVVGLAGVLLQMLVEIRKLHATA
jgi:TRAP-type C4-dicarboxylate transport system permease small subunit